MCKPSDVSCLLDKLLPPSNEVELAVFTDIQLLYAGIAMPSLRVEEIFHEHRFTEYQQIKAANPLRGLVDGKEILKRYAELREQAINGGSMAYG